MERKGSVHGEWIGVYVERGVLWRGQWCAGCVVRGVYKRVGSIHRLCVERVCVGHV